MLPLEALQGFRLGEVIKYVTPTWRLGSVAVFYVAMNKQKWDGLSGDIKKLFDEVSKEYKEKWAVEWNQCDIAGGEFFKSQGGQMIPISDAELSRWIKATEPLIIDYKKDMASKGYKEKEVDGWISFIHERTEYWKAQEKAKGIPTSYQY